MSAARAPEFLEEPDTPASTTRPSARLVTTHLLQTRVTFLVIGGVFFLAASRLDWPQAWAFLIALATAVWMLHTNPALTQERARPGHNIKSWDNLVTDLLQNVEALVRLSCGRDPRLAHALDLIREKQDAAGRWALEHDYTGKTWLDFGPKKQSNPWVTLRAADAEVRTRPSRSARAGMGGLRRANEANARLARTAQPGISTQEFILFGAAQDR